MGEFDMPFPTLASHNPIDYLSFSSFYVETYFNEHILSKATAFCYKKQNQYYLVSNWHVMSGRYPIADKNGIYAPQSKELSIPNKIKVFIYGWENNETEEISIGSEVICECKLLGDNETPLFKSKKYINNEYVDIAVLPINITYNSNGRILKPVCINSAYYEKFKSKDIIHPSDDVFILGYPLGKKDDSGSSIWKRGSIATTLFNRNKFYVDTSTRSGMSGSPVFYINRDANSYLKYRNNDIVDDKIYYIEFLGVYCGRIINEPQANNDSNMMIKSCDVDIAAQLGIVWKNSYIDEIIQET